MVVDDLEPGDYKITELTPTNGTTLVNAVRGDHTGTTPTGAVPVYVHVTGGRTAEDLPDDAQATFTNNLYPGIKIVKIDETTRNDATPTKLKGATFTIQKWNGTGYYPYTPVVMTNTENHVANSTATTDDNGVAVFPKLEPGEYKIEETVLPNGYVKLVSNDIYFKVDYASGTQTITRYKTPMTTKPTENGGVVVVSRVEVSEPYDETIGVYFTARTENEDAIFTVCNVPGVALPSTGGPGTALIYGAGAGLILIAILGLVLTNRKRGRGAGIE